MGLLDPPALSRAEAQNYARTGPLFIPSDTALLKWRTKANEVKNGTGQAHIACLGDSITFGAGATGNSSPKYNTSWPGRLRQMLDARFGRSGTGIVPAQAAVFDTPSYDNRWILGSAVSKHTMGWHRESVFRIDSIANGYVEFTGYGDEFVVYNLSASGGVNNAYVDGGFAGTFRNISSAPTVTFPMQAGYHPKHIVSRIPAGAVGTHTLRIVPDTADDTRDIFLAAVEARVTAPGRFRVSNIGFNGRSLSSLGAVSTNNDETNGLWGLPMVDALKADLLVVALGINDWQGAISAANVKLGLQTLVDRQRGSGNAPAGHPLTNGDVLLVWNAKPDIAGLDKDAALWSAIRNVYYEVAREKNVALLDMSKPWVDFATANGLGLFADLIHPTDKGSADIADAIAVAVIGDRAATPNALTRDAANAKGFVNHGANANTPRPTGFGSIEWMGSVAPANAVVGDTWVDVS